MGFYFDVYGCMVWDKLVLIIKCECFYVGNGRYVYLLKLCFCFVREMVIF